MDVEIEIGKVEKGCVGGMAGLAGVRKIAVCLVPRGRGTSAADAPAIKDEAQLLALKNKEMFVVPLTPAAVHDAVSL